MDEPHRLCQNGAISVAHSNSLQLAVGHQ